ncbi:beta-ketoacyl synthase N-terminal-like domain-containing protein [Streptomyces sp. NPDC048565]|uniref:beta-ketoacyl synthase N-terminal-like domain-containing protein n=1 Tax=Streptomyces sp. NPDC048565 TaxID=3155266 RepID=UPI0034239F25
MPRAHRLAPACDRVGEDAWSCTAEHPRRALHEPVVIDVPNTVVTAGRGSDSWGGAPQQEPVAIVGIGCRFHGGIADPQSFWDLLVTKTDAIVDVPQNHGPVRSGAARRGGNVRRRCLAPVTPRCRP